MQGLIVAVAAAVIAWAVPAALRAAELLMFEERHCPWCERWNDEIGVVFDRTDEGKRAPLRRIDVHDRAPSDVRLLAAVNFTPTFVLAVDGREVGRIEGYPGESFFWPMLADLLDRAADARRVPDD